MRTLWGRQSELSAATVIFYAAGAIFPLLFATVFHAPGQVSSVVLLASSAMSATISLAVLLLGARFTTLFAAVLTSMTSMFLLMLVVVTPLELRALNTGMVFVTVFVYLVWFMPFWFARVLGYLWLALYCLLAVLKFSEEIRPLLLTLVVTTAALGELLGRFKRRIEETSLIDGLCEVWNRRGFRMVLDRELRSGARSGRPLSVLYLDLDGFKAVNDSGGHVEGDRVLRGFTQELTACIRPQDEVARIGGDEFALILPDTDAERASAIGDRLRLQTTVVGWSFGVAEWRLGEAPEGFIARADELMLLDKRRRKSERALEG